MNITDERHVPVVQLSEVPAGEVVDISTSLPVLPSPHLVTDRVGNETASIGVVDLETGHFAFLAPDRRCSRVNAELRLTF